MVTSFPVSHVRTKMAEVEDESEVIPAKRAKICPENDEFTQERVTLTSEYDSDGKDTNENRAKTPETSQIPETTNQDGGQTSISEVNSPDPSAASKPSVSERKESLIPQTTEKDVGITEYISKNPGFHGVLKQRFVDFLVSERNLNGDLVRLTSKILPKTEAKVTPSDCTLSEKEREKIQSVLDSEDKSFSVTLDTDEDKEHRTKIHQAIKQEFPTLDSETVTVDGHKAVRIYRYQGNPAKKRQERWPANRGNYCKFVLCKESKDTMEAISLLAKLLRVKPGVFSYAGTKDRRAVTVQEVRGYRILAERLQGLNKLLRGVSLGNFEYCNEQLRLGDLSGNHFVITLRNVLGEMRDIELAVKSLESIGFINYFGLQRFGTGSVPTHHIGCALILSQWSKAVDLILSLKANKHKSNLNAALELWKSTGDAKGALQKLGREKCIEGYLLQGLANRGGQDFVGALQMIPRNTRLMYVHAYQSFIWNCVVSQRMQKYGLCPVKGDLVALNSEDQNMNTEEPAEFLQNDDEITQISKTCTSRTQVYVLTEEDIASDKYSIHDVVMPMPGFDVKYPEHEAKEWYKDLMAKDGVDIGNMKHRVKDYSLSGAYRRVIIKPQYVSWKFLHYNDVTQPLVLTDLDRLEGRTSLDHDQQGQYLALQLELTLPASCYATMAVRELLKTDTSAAFQSTLN